MAYLLKVDTPELDGDQTHGDRGVSPTRTLITDRYYGRAHHSWIGSTPEHSLQPFGAAYLYGWLARQNIEVGILGKPVREGKGHALSPNYLPMIPPIHITPAEQTVLYWLCKGMSNAEICRATGSSLGTIKSHLASLMKKTHQKTRLQLVIFTYETEIIDLRKEPAKPLPTQFVSLL